MIIVHQDNVAAFAGGHTVYWIGQPLLAQRISATSAGPANEEIEQARAVGRFIHSRMFGRVN